MKGKGMPHLQGYGIGSQNVRVIVEVPKKLNKKQLKEWLLLIRDMEGSVE